MYSFKIFNRPKNQFFPIDVQVWKDKTCVNIHSLHKFWSNPWGISGAEFTDEFETSDQAIDFLKDHYDGFGAALNRIDASIERRIGEFTLTMDLRIARFRGILFSQTQQLRGRI